jgi:hypothetical protein
MKNFIAMVGIVAFISFCVLAYNWHRLDVDTVELDIDCGELQWYCDRTPTDYVARIYTYYNCSE